MHRAKLKSDKCFKPFQINFIQHSRSLIKQNLILFFVGIDSVEKTFSGPASLSTQNKHLFWNPVAPKKFKTPLILTFWRVHISSSKNRVCFWNGQSWETCDNYTKVENTYPFNRILKWQIMGASKNAWQNSMRLKSQILAGYIHQNGAFSLDVPFLNFLKMYFHKSIE